MITSQVSDEDLTSEIIATLWFKLQDRPIGLRSTQNCGAALRHTNSSYVRPLRSRRVLLRTRTRQTHDKIGDFMDQPRLDRK
jgi:hypothetical protein